MFTVRVILIRDGYSDGGTKWDNVKLIMGIVEKPSNADNDERCGRNEDECMNWFLISENVLRGIYVISPLMSPLFLCWLCVSYVRYRHMRRSPVKAAFHFTYPDSLDKIRGDGVIRAGRNGTIYCTLNPRLSRVGTGKTKRKSKTPPVVVFRKNALRQFRKNDSFLAALISGHRFYGIIFCEYLPKEKGDIVILKSRSYLNVLIVEDAEIILPEGKRGFAIRYLSFITGWHKWPLPVLPLTFILLAWLVIGQKDIPITYCIFMVKFTLIFITTCLLSNYFVMKLIRKY
jgi:hypothetical protein